MDLSPDDDNFQGRLLHQAALWDNLELLQELLATGASADSRDASRRSALHAAALAERSRCLAALIDAGADVDARSDERTGGKTALHIAAERGHVENVLVLVSRGASLNVLDAAGDTALALAERARRRHAAQALREARDAQERERASQHKQLRELVARGEAQPLRGRLAALGPAAGLIVNLTPAGGNTLLYMASEAGLATAVAALLDAGADGRAHPATKYAPLHAACYRGHLEVAKLLMQQFPEAVQQETVEKWLPLHAACIGGHAALVTHILEFPYPENLLTTYTDSSGRYTYRLAFDVNARDASGQSALHAACALGALPAVEALLAFSVVGTPVEGTQPPLSPAAVLSPHRAGISLGIHAIVSKLTGGKAEQSDREHHVRPVRLDLLHGGDGVVACAVRAGHARVARRLLAAGAPPDAPARAPDDEPPSPRDRRRSRSASAASRASSSPSPARGGGDAPWSALALAARAKDIATAEALLQHGATDPHGRALRECDRHGLTDLMAAILATKAYPDPDYKLNKSSLSESVFAVSRRDGDAALTYSAVCPAAPVAVAWRGLDARLVTLSPTVEYRVYKFTVSSLSESVFAVSRRDGDAALTYSAVCPAAPVAVAWRGLDARLVTLRMSWLRQASLRVNSKLSSGGGALHAITRLDIANNELRALPAELFTLLSLRHLNAAQNKLERLPSPSDPFEDEIDSKGRKIKRGKKSRLEVYSAPVLQELYLQDNRLEDLPPSLFSLPSLTTLDVSNNKLRALPDTMWTAPALRDLSAALNHLKDLPTGSENRPQPSPSQSSLSGSPQPAASPANGSSQFVFTTQNTNSSRSPSIERSESSEILDDDDAIPTLGSRAGHAVCTETRRAHPWRDAPPPPSPPRGGTPLVSLNLSHNQFTAIPAALACRAPALQRLNMAYNSLRTMSYVTSYPTSLRQLDLSHNEITCWPSLPQLDNLGAAAGDPLACHCPGGPPPRAPRRGPARRRLLGAACPARTHLRLEGLRTLILSNNMLTRIQLTTDDDGLATPETSTGDDDDDEWGAGLPHKGRLLFPLLSMLDVSCNLLRTVPPAIHELTSLAVLNISGNKEITDLPPQMGLLSRLWNLNTVGCSLNEPLRSMVSSGRYKSMDIVGYLLSVLQEARPYARCKLMVVGLQGLGKTSLLECLRQESSIQHRRKPTDHWARRMGNKSSKRNVSTVGVDIGAWVYEKQRSARGPVTFRTWDFGGQHEYYATHQYFLSRRSLYLVVWNVTDGKKGLAGALEWLRSIQARAPGSSVIMVATHYDQVANSNLPESESPEALQRLIRSAVMGAPDADKLGLPRVVDSLEVSCSTRHNIRLLADIIYSVAFSVKPPGSKEPLLEQLVPATYLALEECVTALAADEPVLRHDRYKALVTQYMQQKNLRMFRDAAELHQATMFLHENGVLLHYDDATLKELYFLRPQWLCDVLAHVVTVREINPFAQNGIMKLEDLAHVFKASPQLSRGTGEEASALGVSLLGKFELALCWDARVLLVPPLLPVAEPKEGQLPLRNRPWGAPRTPRRVVPAAISLAPASAAAAAVPLTPALDHAHGTDSPTLIQEPLPGISIAGRSGAPAVRRLLLLSYVPCGFWPRLCTRVLADNALAEAAAGLYRPPAEVEVDDSLSKALELPWRWKLWRTGLRLACGGFTMAVLRELPALADPVLGIDEDPNDDREHPYRGVRFRVMLEGAWSLLSPSRGASVELELPALVAVLRRQDGLPIGGYQSISLEPHPETLARLLALLADHVDLLLEDWYPSLGTRFVHTSEGRCLITRLVPCPACLRDASDADRPGEQAGELAQALNRLDLAQPEPRRARVSEESRTSDGDSGVGAESNASSRIGSVEGAGADPPRRVAHAWTVEECILGSCTAQTLRCPRHGADARLRDVAPDTLLLDVPESHLARWSSVSLHSVAGRGAFGTVLSGTWRRAPVAVKALQPVPPPKGGELTDTHAYKAALSRWEREPLTAACRAYCGLRQELTVLRQLKHAHVAPLVAVCSAPLALLLALAPMGALDCVLRSYRSAGERVGARAARLLALQAARALEYLHAKRVVYRDLKSENVLVWAMPPPAQARAAELSAKPMDVHIKLGDYGISRLTPPSGTKGFGGTEGFMAPEIMRYNGEEEYNEKVDCFSYGMLLYEIVALRQPFEGHEAVKEAVLDGARPPLSSKELHYPCCILETMRRCWHSAPGARPSAAALASLAAAPEYAALQDAAGCHGAAAAVGVPVLADEDSTEAWEVWYGGEPGRVHALLTAPDRLKHHHSVTLPVDEDTSEAVSATAICRVGNKVWVGDSAGRVLVYCASTCQLSWRARPREAVGGARSRVAALQHLPAARRVALALACGRMFLVTSSRPALEGGFVLTELGTATDLRCLAAVPTPKGFEVWAGGDSLTAYSISNGGVCGAEAVAAAEGVAAAARVTLLAAADEEPYVIVCFEPGTCIYQYCVRTRAAAARLDCSKLAPCSESLQSSAVEDGLPAGGCRITSLCAVRGVVAAGTARGCVLLADAGSLRPLTVFRPYEGQVSCLIPLPRHGSQEPMLVSLGSTYRPLVQRFTPNQNNSNNSSQYSGPYCLLWRTQRWLPD